MLADRAPSAWLASQMSHWAAAVVASSVAERRGPGEVADAAVAEGRLVVDDEAVAVEVGAAGEGGEQVGGRGRDVGHRRRSPVGRVAAHGTAASRSPTPTPDQRPGLTTIRKTMTTISSARNIPPRWIFLTVARTRRRRSGRRAGGGGVERQLDQVMQGVALDGERIGEVIEVQDDPGDQPRLVCGSICGRDR